MREGIRHSRPLTIFATLLGAAVVTLGIPAVAAACTHSTTSTAFAQFGDQADYVLAPGGSFEEGAHGWTLSNADIVAGNESFNLSPGAHSLAIGPRGAATTPWLCVNGEYPSFRFVARQLSGAPDEPLYVSLRWINLLGITLNTPIAAVHGGSEWAPSPALQLGDTLPLWVPGTSLNLGLVFSSPGEARWAIDDVYIDPYSR